MMSCDVTYEELAVFVDGDMAPGRLAEIDRHVKDCQDCADRLDALKRGDALLGAMPPAAPSAGAILAARRAISAIIRPEQSTEIMTLDEVADFLRITPDQLGEVVEELPAFELAGQIRLRRETLVEWIQQRERDYTRQRSQSWVAASAKIGLGTTVA